MNKTTMKQTNKRVLGALAISITCVVMLWVLELTNQDTFGTTAMFGFGAAFSISYLVYHEKDVITLERRFLKRLKRAIKIIAQEYYTSKGTSN